MKRLISIIAVIGFLTGCATIQKVTPEYVAREAMKIDKTCPIKLDGGITLIRAESKGKTFIYYYTVPNNYNKQISEVWNKKFSNFDISFSWDQTKIIAEENTKADLCGGEVGQYMYFNGTAFHFFFTTKDGKQSFNFFISKESCSGSKGKPQTVREAEMLNSLCPLKMNDEQTLKEVQLRGSTMIMNAEMHNDTDLISSYSYAELTARETLRTAAQEGMEKEKLPPTSPYDAFIMNFYNKRGEFLYSLTQKKEVIVPIVEQVEEIVSKINSKAPIKIKTLPLVKDGIDLMLATFNRDNKIMTKYYRVNYDFGEKLLKAAKEQDKDIKTLEEAKSLYEKLCIEQHDNALVRYGIILKYVYQLKDCTEFMRFIL